MLKPFWGFLAAQHQPFGNENIYFDPLGDAREGSIPLPRTEPGVPQFAVLDMDPLIRDGRGLVRIELSGMDGEELKARAERLVLVTDLGLIVKKGADGRRDVFVCSLSEGGPVAGAAVRVLGANGLPVAETVSDAGGRAALPSLSGLERERRPVAVTAQRGEDMAWLPLNDGSLVVDYSRFPVRGQIGADGVNAYVFGQRGMFRPGETLRFGMIVGRLEAASAGPAAGGGAARSFRDSGPAASVRRGGGRPRGTGVDRARGRAHRALPSRRADARRFGRPEPRFRDGAG